MSLKNIIYLSEEDFTTLSTSGSLTKGGQTLTYDPLNDVYCVPSQAEKHHYLHHITFTGSVPPQTSFNVGAGDFYVITTDSAPINTPNLLLDKVVDGGLQIINNSHLRTINNIIKYVSGVNNYIRVTGYTWDTNSGLGHLTNEAFTWTFSTGTLYTTITDTVKEV